METVATNLSFFLFSVVHVSWFERWGTTALVVVGTLFVLWLIPWLTLRFIPNDRVGIVEKLWSAAGSVPEGRIVALGREAGYQAELLRGGIHFGYWRWQYRIHKTRLVTIAQGKIGYVYARDGAPLPSGQTLGRVIDCNHYQDAREFLDGVSFTDETHGQRGRQRGILREGVYAINAAVFVVITESRVHALRQLLDPQEVQSAAQWRDELLGVNGFEPVIIGQPMPAPHPLDPECVEEVDSIGIVTVHDGPSLAPGEIIAPAVGTDPADQYYHNNFQDPEAFLAGGGRRGRQYVSLTDGTYFINRWFAKVELNYYRLEAGRLKENRELRTGSPPLTIW
jgi:uncharacterized membrane protein YqiK